MKKILHFDIESTGLEITKDRIIQLSLITTDTTFNILEKRKKNFSNCGVPIHPKAFEAHKISEEMIKNEKPFASFAKSVLSIFDQADYIAGYNIKGFDIALLYEEFSRAGLEWIPKPAIDPGTIFKKRESRTLSAAVKFYCGKEMIDAHDAENDVLATIEVLRGQVERYGFDKYLIMLTEASEHAPEGFQPLEEVLIKESCFDNEDSRLTFDGKIILNDDGVAVFNFGKWRDRPVSEADLGYINFIMMGDFPVQTKNVLRSLINKK